MWGVSMRLRDASVDKASALHACFAYFTENDFRQQGPSLDTWLALSPPKDVEVGLLAASGVCGRIRDPPLGSYPVQLTPCCLLRNFAN